MNSLFRDEVYCGQTCLFAICGWGGGALERSSICIIFRELESPLEEVCEV